VHAQRGAVFPEQRAAFFEGPRGEPGVDAPLEPAGGRADAAVVVVDDEQVVAAMRLTWQVLKQVIEPSSATVLAAVLAEPARFAGRRVGLVLSGGNVDLDALPW